MKLRLFCSRHCFGSFAALSLAFSGSHLGRLLRFVPGALRPGCQARKAARNHRLQDCRCCHSGCWCRQLSQRRSDPGSYLTSSWTLCFLTFACRSISRCSSIFDFVSLCSG